MITCERYLASSKLANTLPPPGESSLWTSPGFMHLFTHLGGQPVWWLALDDGAPRAAIAGVEFGGRWLKRFQSMPDGLYSRLNVAAEARESIDTTAHALLQAIALHRYRKVFIYDYHFSFPSLPQWKHRDLVTHQVEIPSPQWMPPNRQLRTEIRKAEREDLHVEPFNAARHIEGFMHLVSITARRNRTSPRYPRSFFDALAALAQQDDRIVWRWAEHDGTPVASHIYLLEPPMALAWQIFFDKQFASLKANQFLLHQAATMLADRGISILNLGGSPAGIQTVVDFKEKWGAEQYRYPMYYRKHGLGRWL